MVASTSFTIRAARPEDAAAIADVHIRTWQEAYRGQLPQRLLDDLPQSYERRKSIWREAAGRGEREALVVAERDGRVVVSPMFGRAGIPMPAREYGTGDGPLSSRGELEPGDRQGPPRGGNDQAASGRFTEAMLWVLKSNHRTRRFYESQGWRPDGSEQVDRRGDVEMLETRYRIDLSRGIPRGS